MRSALRTAASKPVVPLGTRSSTRGMSYSLSGGSGGRELYLRQMGVSGTIFGIISLLAESSATPEWQLFKKQPVDGRRRYSSSDQGSDQRIEVVQHAAVQLWNSPNTMHSGFEFREGCQQHLELTGETFWVLNNEIGFPTAMWYVRPDRMDPLYDTDGNLIGWMYSGPNGEQVPLTTDEVILEKRPDPLDPYRGLGPVQAILPNIQQQRYATEYQRNLFLNGADPGGIITFPNALPEGKLDELIDRWREGHRGVARAGHIGVLEDGATFQSAAHNNRDMEYEKLRLSNRDEIREAWRIHKAMMGTSDDVNRANAQTAQEVFVAWQVKTRLNRRRDTLNSKLLPKFKDTSVEFDYKDPTPDNAETAAQELLAKSQAFAQLVDAGCDPHAALEVVGLPDMDMVSDALSSTGMTAVPTNKLSAQNKAIMPAVSAKEADAKVFQQASQDFPPSATAWMHTAQWKGPVNVPLTHIDWTPDEMDKSDPNHVQDFVNRIQDGKKVKPVILVKTPGNDKLQLVDGHHRYLAYAQLDMPVKAFVGTVNADHGPWEDMHSAQEPKKQTDDTSEMVNTLRRIMTDGYIPVQLGALSTT